MHHDHTDHSRSPGHADNFSDKHRTGPDTHLARMDEVHDYKIAEGDPDIRGWDVKTAEGVKVGEVDTLVIDTDALKVRYFDVELDKHELKLDDNRHVVLPIGTAQLDPGEDCVLLAPSSTVSELVDLSMAEGAGFDRDAEVALRQRLDKDYREDPERDFYAAPHYDADHFFANHRR